MRNKAVYGLIVPASDNCDGLIGSLKMRVVEATKIRRRLDQQKKP
jgi:hypothetical protein